MIRVTLPWPARPLWPNWRGHWSKKAAAVRIAKTEARYLTHLAIGFQVHARGTESLAVALTFQAPTRRRYDVDGALGACKAALDGIADALGVDDSRFQLTLERGEPAKPGCVLVTISEAAVDVREA